uniref:Probable U2 small nuclear ribonucleoprotein A' n=1 Tax=Gongylonema pulchrum TaxID=637853 RepID=A0A183CWJ4_9BILA
LVRITTYSTPSIDIRSIFFFQDQFDTIDLTDNDIRKLENIPLLKRLSTLLMHNNRVQQIMPNIGEVLPSLKTLALTNNNLCELGDIDPLSTCPKLEYLTLIGNPLTHKPHYRLYVIYKVPSVRVLDFKRIRLVERKQADNLFKGKKGEKLRESVVKRSKTVPEDEDEGPRNLRAGDVRKIEVIFRCFFVKSLCTSEFCLFFVVVEYLIYHLIDIRKKTKKNSGKNIQKIGMHP